MSYFDNIQPIKYEGPTSTNPLSFKFYNPDQVILGKTMREHMRFAIAYWHSFSANGSDPFGAGTNIRAWDKYDGMELAKARVDACFELLNILGCRLLRIPRPRYRARRQYTARNKCNPRRNRWFDQR